MKDVSCCLAECYDTWSVKPTSCDELLFFFLSYNADSSWKGRHKYLLAIRFFESCCIPTFSWVEYADITDESSDLTRSSDFIHFNIARTFPRFWRSRNFFRSIVLKAGATNATSPSAVTDGIHSMFSTMSKNVLLIGNQSPLSEISPLNIINTLNLARHRFHFHHLASHHKHHHLFHPVNPPTERRRWNPNIRSERFTRLYPSQTRLCTQYANPLPQVQPPSTQNPRLEKGCPRAVRPDRKTHDNKIRWHGIRTKITSHAERVHWMATSNLSRTTSEEERRNGTTGTSSKEAFWAYFCREDDDAE